jgi:thymidylate synthase (FAD)
MKNRQNSIKLKICNEGGDDSEIKNMQLIDEWREKQEGVFVKVKETYDWAINNGIAKEQARAILPEGNTPSRMYMNGTLRSWIHYIQLRSGNGTQEEHRIIAIECAKAIGPIFPMIKEFVSI